MTTTLAPLASWVAAYEAACASDDAAGRARRAAAWAQFGERGFPTRRDEEWRHTDVRALSEGTWASGGQTASPAPRLDAPDPSGPRIVFHDGRYLPDVSSTTGLPPGVTVRPLSEALADDEALRTRWGSLTEAAPSALTFLHDALWREGFHVRVAAGTNVEVPLDLTFVASATAGARVACHPRIAVEVGAGARLAIAEHWLGSAGLENAVVEAWVGANARLDWLVVQAPTAGGLQVRHAVVHQERDSRFHGLGLALGPGRIRNDVVLRLAGEGAEGWIDGLTILDGAARADHVTTIDHAAPHCSSHELYKGILDDESVTAFSGRILVRPGAQKTDARQSNHNLLLSRKALAHSIPQLEIFADDVKCAHGATVGQLDDEALFYLRSRGLDEHAARRLLVGAFAGAVIERLPDDALRARADSLVARRVRQED